VISIASCRICSLDPDIRRAIDIDLASGMSFRAIGRKYAKQINRAKPYNYVSAHARCGNVGKTPGGPSGADPGTVTAIKEERHRKSVDERIDELYKLSLAGCKLALDEKRARDLAACIAQGIAATALMGKGESPDANKGASAIIAYVESEKAKENQKA
jgi:hypothetical protein